MNRIEAEDVACAVARIMQINNDCLSDDGTLSVLGVHLWERLWTCDVPRLLAHVATSHADVVALLNSLLGGDSATNATEPLRVSLRGDELISRREERLRRD